MNFDFYTILSTDDDFWNPLIIAVQTAITILY